MTRLLLLAAATITLPTAASAQALGHYVATPANPAKVAKVTTRGTAWFPRNGRLLAARAPETPAKLCQLVVQKVGPLAGFTVGGLDFDADALTQCNAAVPSADKGAAVAAK